MRYALNDAWAVNGGLRYIDFGDPEFSYGDVDLSGDVSALAIELGLSYSFCNLFVNNERPRNGPFFLFMSDSLTEVCIRIVRTAAAATHTQKPTTNKQLDQHGPRGGGPSQWSTSDPPLPVSQA